PGAPLSRPPAATAALWKASTAAAVVGPEGKMNRACREAELTDPKPSIRSANHGPALPLPKHLHAERRERRGVERFALPEIVDVETDMVEHGPVPRSGPAGLPRRVLGQEFPTTARDGPAARRARPRGRRG